MTNRDDVEDFDGDEDNCDGDDYEEEEDIQMLSKKFETRTVWWVRF